MCVSDYSDSRRHLPCELIGADPKQNPTFTYSEISLHGSEWKPSRQIHAFIGKGASGRVEPGDVGRKRQSLNYLPATVG